MRERERGYGTAQADISPRRQRPGDGQISPIGSSGRTCGSHNPGLPRHVSGRCNGHDRGGGAGQSMQAGSTDGLRQSAFQPWRVRVSQFPHPQGQRAYHRPALGLPSCHRHSRLHRRAHLRCRGWCADPGWLDRVSGVSPHDSHPSCERLSDTVRLIERFPCPRCPAGGKRSNDWADGQDWLFQRLSAPLRNRQGQLATRPSECPASMPEKVAGERNSPAEINF